MIPRADITAWRNHAPWKLDSQVEQDLIICRILVELFSHDEMGSKLAFRGGTALHKLFLEPPARYSEDIDLVQVTPSPIGTIIDSTRGILDATFGKPKIQQKHDAQVLIYRVESEIPPIVPLRIKIETNSREHFTAFGIKNVPFKVDSRWFSGSCSIATYELDELLGTKLRALYQRRKGRDLFDLWLGLTKGNANPAKIVETFHKYVWASGLTISRKDFKSNLALKMKHPAFLSDIDALIRPEIEYNPQEAYELVSTKLLDIV